MGDQKKVQLSKGLLDMKFMKRTKERVEKDADDAVGQELYAHEITECERKKGEITFIECSLSQCCDFPDGRFSFGGMNPAIEKMMEEEASRRKAAKEKRKEVCISDETMASQSSVAESIGKKFKTKKQRKFMKPSTDE